MFLQANAAHVFVRRVVIRRNVAASRRT